MFFIVKENVFEVCFMSKIGMLRTFLEVRDKRLARIKWKGMKDACF